MSLFRVQLAVTTIEEIEVYAPDQDIAIDRAIEQAETRKGVKKVKFLDMNQPGPEETTESLSPPST